MIKFMLVYRTLVVPCIWLLACATTLRAGEATSAPLHLEKLERLPSSPLLLKVPDGAGGDFAVAQHPPEIDFAIFPNQREGARLWSSWGDSLCASDGKFYASIGDHAAPHGTTYVYQIDPHERTVRLVVDYNAVVGLRDGQSYAPGKIHGALVDGQDGWIYFLGYYGSARRTGAETGYRGDWLLRYHLATGKAESLGIAVPDCSTPVLLMHGGSRSLYGLASPGQTSPNSDDRLFRYQIDDGKVVYNGGPVPNMARSLILAGDGRAWYSHEDEETGHGVFARYDPKDNQIEKLPLRVPGGGQLRASSRTDENGQAYCITRDGVLFAFDTKTEQVTELGQAFVCEPLYTATCRLDPSGRYLYYLPGAHGKSDRSGTPLIQFDVKTRRLKVIAFLNELLRQHKGYNLGGTYGIALNQDGSQLLINFNGAPLGNRQPDFGLCSAMIVHIPESERTGETEMELGIGGAGGAYFLASPGELVVDVEKRDRNRRGSPAQLRAILVGPDRQVLQEVTIPDDGRPRGSGLGPIGRARLATQVDRKGVYGLNVTVSQDRYGEEIVWGFRTNCPHYLIETSRGHRDERHQEPIVLLNPARSGNVCFVPRPGALTVDVADVPSGVDRLALYDANGTLIHAFDVDAQGKASHTFPAAVHREATPWRLHLPAQQATIQIDGVTRWEPNDPYPDLSLWTPDPKSYFPFPEYRWLSTPYSKTVYGRPGEGAQIAFQVHNNSVRQKTVQLSIEFPEAPWPARLSAQRVVVGAKRTAEVTVAYTAPSEGEARVCHLRATPEEDASYSTYSTLTVKAGEAPAAKPLNMPIVLKPYRHENEQFGYLPDYPTENQMYFDLKNRPFVRTGGGVATLTNGQWTTTHLQTAVTSRVPSLERTSFGTPTAKIAFDRDNDLYLLATAGPQAALLHSADGGKTFSANLIPGRASGGRALDIEQFSGHNVPDGPPPVLRYTQTASDPQRIWRRINDLELFLAEKVDGRISFGDPILISKQCIGLSAHSGIPAGVVSRGTKVHVAWAEATEPDAKVPGVPTYVVTYDRVSKRLGEPVLVGHGAPPNDIHNSPSITMDSQGYLHVLAGTHGRPFPYARSLQPNDAHSGWTEPVAVGEGLPQTYIGLVCGPDDTLHLVYRLWWYGTDPFPASHHATLAYQRKRPGQPWESPRVLIVPPFSEYSIFYHRLTIDQTGRLFLSYDYWSTHWFYRNDHRGNRRALLVSADGGQTWKLGETRDLQHSN